MRHRSETFEESQFGRAGLTLGQLEAQVPAEQHLPLIGDAAPSFTAVTTQGTIHFPEDYKGKWVILFSHPADFTPVCTTEFMTFASMADEFKALNTELVGLSVDSLYAHIAWHAAITALERGDVETALAIYDDKVRPPVSQALPINVVSDGASLLWRLDAYGHGAPRDLWREVADYARAAFPRAGHAFLDAHMALIEATSGDRQALEARISTLEAMVDSGAMPAGPVVPGKARSIAGRALPPGPCRR